MTESSDEIYERIKREPRAELVWSGWVKAKVPGVRGHQIFRPGGWDARSPSGIDSWAQRRVAQLLADGAEIIAVGMAAEVK